MLGCAAMVGPLAARAQHAGKISRIGFLEGSEGQNFDAFFQRLRDLGWVDGKNVLIERRKAVGRSEQLSAFAVELVQLKVDVIVAGGGPASLNAAREATKTIPIVMVASSRDPIGGGLIESYARPGGNITGLTTAPEDLTGKQLEYLKEVVPGLSRVGFFWDTSAGVFSLPRETAETAELLAVKVVPFEVREPSDFDHVVAAAAKTRVGGLILVGSPMFVRNRKQLADLLTKHRLPAISIWNSFPEAGVLMAYGPSLRDLFGRAAVYVDKILRGANPADLPVERPSKFDLVINLKTAKALGITIPQSLLLRADDVIQ